MHERSQMTPTLTNAQKYSSEFGFEPGVVVAVNRRSTPPYFDDGITIYGELDRVRDGVIAVGGQLIRIDDIVSIKLLSWPWAVWQGAPADAIGVSIDRPFGDVKFFIKGEQKQFDEYRREHWTFTNLDAPWWWLEGQK